MHFEILEVAAVGKEDMAVETVAGIVVGIEAEDTAACPCMLKVAEENFLKGFDKQNLAQDFLFVSS